jgi:hypothetical protein
MLPFGKQQEIVPSLSTTIQKSCPETAGTLFTVHFPCVLEQHNALCQLPTVDCLDGLPCLLVVWAWPHGVPASAGDPWVRRGRDSMLVPPLRRCPVSKLAVFSSRLPSSNQGKNSTEHQ